MSETELNNLRNDIANFVDIARDREIALYEVQSIYRNTIRGLSGRNWDSLKAKLNGEFNLAKLGELKEKLNKLITSHIYFDDKLISIYTDVKEIQVIKSKLETLSFDPKKDLDENITPLEIVELKENFIMFLFGQRRELTVREHIDLDDLKDSVSDEYQEIIGIKKVPLDCFDSILLDIINNRVIVSMDLASVLRRNEINVIQNNFVHYLKDHFGNNLTNSSQIFDNPLDLFPCIQKFYEESIDESKLGVIEINFVTPAGTAHYEKLRGETKDLRTATYHKMGVEGVKNEKAPNGKLLNNDITPYRICMAYYHSTPALEISLKSSYIAINATNGSHLYDASLYGVRSLDDYNFILEKLLKLR
ncbi:hypothetical protein ABFW07_10205 [Acinetobacter soli]|uniref:hypothetical protein n=1 Tax=Acinetobacter soli TaxID=487316 RepID=UPI0032181808